jgi:hypothetical protein
MQVLLLAVQQLFFTAYGFELEKSILAIIISVSIAAFILYNARNSGTKIRIISIGVSYICFLFAYAGVYNIFFIYNPNNFKFSDSIKTEKATNQFENSISDLLSLNEELYILTLLHSEPEVLFKAAKEDTFFKITRTKGYFFDVDKKVRMASITNFVPPETVFIEILYEDKVFSYGGTNIFNPEYWIVKHLINTSSARDAQKTLNNLIKLLQERRSKLKVKIKENIQMTSSWNFFDFLYFSTVTITTLGYGDIIPNSTPLRVTVITETIIGILFLAYALSLFRSRID